MSSTACYNCGNASFKVRLRSDAFEIQECAHCRLACTSPNSYVANADYDHLPELSNRYVVRSSFTRQYAEALLKTLTPHVADASLLDVGCSIGVLVKTASAIGYVAEGIDLDANAVAIAKKEGLNVHVATTAEWRGGPYDIISVVHTLEHIADPIAFLKDCGRLLKPTGRLLISVPCHDGLLPRLLNRRWYGWQPTQHFYHYSARSLVEVMARAGLRASKTVQNAMDHRPSQKNTASLKIRFGQWIFYVLASVGAASGKGDQLCVLARPSGG